MNRHVSALSVVLLLVAAPPARAHEFWLSPSRYRLAAGDTLTVGAEVGTGFRGEAKPYAATRVHTLVTIGARRIDLSRLGLNGDLVFARWIAPDSGGQLVGYESDFAEIQLPPADFDAYLKLEGLDGPRAARAALGNRAGPGRERYARCPKTWIAGDDPKRAQAVIGLPLEVVALGDPLAPGPLTVKVLWQGKPLAGALVGAWRQALGERLAPRAEAARDSVGSVTRVRTGRDGTARVLLAGDGEWMVAAVHMVPSTDRDAADWESWWASYTFAREAKRP